LRREDFSGRYGSTKVYIAKANRPTQRVPVHAGGDPPDVMPLSEDRLVVVEERVCLLKNELDKALPDALISGAEGLPGR
jgi:hypothetical protein